MTPWDLSEHGIRRREWGVGMGLLAATGLNSSVFAKAPAESLVQLASVWTPGRSPQGFLMSEKFDGVRAVWDGKTLRFRSGRTIMAPDWFVKALPDMPLDGELWSGRGQFDRLSGTVRQMQPKDALWDSVTYMVFDTPAADMPFEQRIKLAHKVVRQTACLWLDVVAQSTVDNARALQTLLDITLRRGGEGLVLHRADALWQAGRTSALFKFKPTPDDEALVVGHVPGQGRLTGQTGALLVETPEGQRFALGSGLNDAQRRNPPPVGVWVTYRYRDLTPSGLPRFASFVRVRDPE